ncbi:Serine/threonine-protein kinase Nek4 [Trichoplax sp. H2]|nr:Serine/threonine-protein kinase Nek4 [Trichoplax sp. H2]|eukprot:RDD44562.1 Serine/threonine-protein kinase Nek4 [Trichoplax sp. H2]
MPLDSFNVLKQIGKGSYGEVFLVRHKRGNKKYVMKKIQLKNASTRERKAAQQEALLLKKLIHPNIVSYKDSFQDRTGYLYIIMGFCEGGDVYNYLKNRNGLPIDESQVMVWFMQIALALQFMHSNNILHRDLKTQNIFLTKHDIIKVGDLGIARVLEGSWDLATTRVGTPYYMSPELFSNQPYNHKSDVWALGCCVYEMLTLKHAFSAKDLNSLVYKILNGKVPQMPKQYSTQLGDIVKSTLALDPKNRPSVPQLLRLPYMKRHISQFLQSTDHSSKQASKEKSNKSEQTIQRNNSESSLSSVSTDENVTKVKNKYIVQSPKESSVDNATFVKGEDNEESGKLSRKPSDPAIAQGTEAKSSRRGRPLPDPPVSAQSDILSSKSTISGNEGSPAKSIPLNRRRQSEPVNSRSSSKEYALYFELQIIVALFNFESQIFTFRIYYDDRREIEDVEAFPTPKSSGGPTISAARERRRMKQQRNLFDVSVFNSPKIPPVGEEEILGLHHDVLDSIDQFSIPENQREPTAQYQRLKSYDAKKPSTGNVKASKIKQSASADDNSCDPDEDSDNQGEGSHSDNNMSDDSDNDNELQPEAKKQDDRHQKEMSSVMSLMEITLKVSDDSENEPQQPEAKEADKIETLRDGLLEERIRNLKKDLSEIDNGLLQECFRLLDISGVDDDEEPLQIHET